MQPLVERQSLLISSLREISIEYWRLMEKTLTTPELRYHKIKVERVRRALLHDCALLSEQIDGLSKWRWEQLVLNAGIPTPADTRKSASKGGSVERDYPSNLKADQLPLPDTED